MTELIRARAKIANLLNLLKTSGGLLLDAQIVETVPDPSARTPQISVDFSGTDAPLLLLDNEHLLSAIQDVVHGMLRLETNESQLLSLDVNHVKADRRAALQRLADSAVALVRETGEPFAFASMRSSDRRFLHQALLSSGLKSAGAGTGFKRCVVLYPEGVMPPVEQSRRPACDTIPGHQGTAA